MRRIVAGSLVSGEVPVSLVAVSRPGGKDAGRVALRWIGTFHTGQTLLQNAVRGGQGVLARGTLAQSHMTCSEVVVRLTLPWRMTVALR